MNIKKLTVFILSILLFGFISIYFVTYFHNKIIKLQTQEYLHDSNEIKKHLENMIDEKQKATMAIAISLSKVTLLNNLCLDNQHTSENYKVLQNISSELKQYTAYKNVWIQYINKEGISQARSWTNESGDSLLEARQELRDLLSNPRKTSVLSVGKYTLSFKSIVPVYNKDKSFLGLIEVITHFNSIDHELAKHGYYSVLLVDKSYKKQLTHSLTKNFVDNYYVANFTLDESAIKLLNNVGAEKCISNDYSVFDTHFFITHYTIMSSNNTPMAYYILIKNINEFNYQHRDRLIKSIQYTIAVGVFLILFTLMLFYIYNYKAHKQKEYYQNIVNTASEIILITDGNNPLDANEAFFDFFHSYKDLEEFKENLHCICDLFIKEEGFISKQMGNLTWIEYIFAHPNIEHKAKINYKEKTYIFSIHLRQLEKFNNTVYTLALSDITAIEKYKNKLEYLSRTDNLTKIGNRYTFQKEFKKEFKRSKRYNTALSLLMLDIDHFKIINDTYGHDIGDKVLIELSKEISRLLRSSDRFCRYGGEEFMIIMPETTLMEIQIIAERIRLHIEKMQVENVKKVTISIGITQLQKEDSMEAIIKRADNALYVAKESGRNRVDSA